MIDLTKIENIYIIPGYTDMRKQADGLLSTISINNSHLETKPNQLYIFCGKSRTIIKILEVDDTGVWIYYKRLNADKFIWPRDTNISLVEKRQLLWFLQGLNITQKTAHKAIKYDY